MCDMGQNDQKKTGKGTDYSEKQNVYFGYNIYKETRCMMNAKIFWNRRNEEWIKHKTKYSTETEEKANG